MNKELIQDQENLEDSNTEQVTDLSESAINNPDEWQKHLEEADKAVEEARPEPVKSKINLSKPKVFIRDKEGKLVPTTREYNQRYYSKFNRYPKQQSEVKNNMQEALENGTPLRIVNIGVAHGQEALGYIQMASDMAGESSIDDALDLELVEYADGTELPVDYAENGISESSANYLKNLFDSPKAHFGTPFQEFVKDLKAKGEKRDVVLFNNVIQHLSYDAPKEQMLQDMQNMADVVADGGMFCMTCNQYNSNEKKYERAIELFDDTVDMLKKNGFEGDDSSIYDAGKTGRQIIFKKVKPSSPGE